MEWTPAGFWLEMWGFGPGSWGIFSYFAGLLLGEAPRAGRRVGWLSWQTTGLSRGESLSLRPPGTESSLVNVSVVLFNEDESAEDELCLDTGWF